MTMEKLPKISMDRKKDCVNMVQYTQVKDFNDVTVFYPNSTKTLLKFFPDYIEVEANILGKPTSYTVNTEFKLVNRKNTVSLYVVVSPYNYNVGLIKNTFDACGHSFDDFIDKKIKIGSYELTSEDFVNIGTFSDLYLGRAFGEWASSMAVHTQDVLQEKMDQYLSQFSDTERKALVSAKNCVEGLKNADKNINDAFATVAGLMSAYVPMQKFSKDNATELEHMIESTLDSVVRSIIYIGKIERVYDVVDYLGKTHYKSLSHDDVRNALYKLIEKNSDSIQYNIEHEKLSGYEVHESFSLKHSYAESFTGVDITESHVKIG